MSHLGTPAAFYPVSVDSQETWTSGDLEGDGDVDLVVADNTADVLTVLLNDGAGGFTSATTPWPQTTGSPVLDDLDTDGALDLAWGNHIASGSGTGGFGTPTAALPAGIEVRAAALLDGDDDLDLVVTDASFDPKVGVQFGDGTGGFAAPTWTTLRSGDAALFSLVTEDVDGDGLLDVAAEGVEFHEVCAPSGGCWLDQFPWVQLRRGTGAGGFGDVSPRPPGVDFAIADVDEDGVLDAVTPSSGKNFGVRVGQGAGNFGPATSHVGPGLMCNLATVDVDQDGHVDVVSPAGADIGWIVHGDGAGGFGRSQGVTTAHTPASESCGRVIAAQLDGTGKPDLVFLSDEADRIAVLLNTAP